MIVDKLRNLYATPHRNRVERLATFVPRRERAAVARTQHAALVERHGDLAQAIYGLDMKALERRMVHDLFAVLARVRVAAGTLKNLGTTADLTESVRATAAIIDSPLDRTYEASVQLLVRTLERAEGTVTNAAAAGHALEAGLAILADAPVLAAEAVNVPPMVAGSIAEIVK